MINRVAHVAIEVPDLEATVQFYKEYIGLEVTERDDETAYLTCNERHHEAILIQSPNGATGLHHLALEVPTGGLSDAIDSAVAAGARLIGPTVEPGVQEAVMIEDPNGFRWKLYSGMEWVPALPRTSLPRPLTFSHYNIAGPDVPNMATFVREGFDLRPSDWLGDKDDPFVCWYHCPTVGALHHGIAIIKAQTVKLHHVAYDYASIGDLAARVDHYVTRDRLLVWGMGRHGTGGGLFAYVEDPAGLMIELSAEMIRIGDDPRWDQPEVWELDDPRGVNTWGSPVPEPWLAHGVPLANSAVARPA